MQTLFVPSFGDPTITTRLAACTQGLRPTFEEGVPFALSYSLYHTNTSLYIDPKVCLHAIEDGEVAARALAEYPDLAAAFATQAFTMLGWDDIFWRACEALPFTMSDGVEYTFAFTPHGIVMVADRWTSTQHTYGSKAIALAFLDPALTPHQEGAARQTLAEAITRLLARQGTRPVPPVAVAPLEYRATA